MGIFNRTEWKIFFTFFIIYSLFAHTYGWSEITRLDLTMAMVDDGSFSIDSYYQNTGDRAIIDGHYYSEKPPGISFLAVPVYTTYKFLFGIPTVGNELYAPLSKSFSVLMFLAIVFISALFGALSIVLLYKLSSYFVNKKEYKFLIILLYGLGTLIFVYSRSFIGHSVSTFFAFLSFYLLFLSKKKGKDHIFYAGLSAGFGVMAEYSVLIILSFSFLLAIIYFKKRAWKYFMGFSIFLSLLLGYNYFITNNLAPVYSYADPYIWNDFVNCQGQLSLDEKSFCDYLLTLDESNCYKITNNELYNQCYFSYSFLEAENCQSIPFDSARNTCEAIRNKDCSYCSDINDSKLKGTCDFSCHGKSIIKVYIDKIFGNSKERAFIIMRVLFFPYRGLLFYYPILIFSIIGLFFMFKEYKYESIYIALIFFGYLLYNSILEVWWGGYAFGPRQLTPLMPFLMIPLLFSLKKIKLKYILPFIVISLFFNFLSLQVPEEAGLGKEVVNFEAFGNPLFEHYLPKMVSDGPGNFLLQKAGLNIGGWTLVAITALACYFIWRKELNSIL